jgi:hypothetical protein
MLYCPRCLPSGGRPGNIRPWLALTLLVCAAVTWAPAHGQSPEARARALAGALKLAAPRTDRPDLYSDWKVKAAIIPDWSRRCLGKELTPAEFAANREEARRVVECIMARELGRELQQTADQNLAVRRAAAWWMTGNPDQYDQGSTAEYTDKVLFYYRELLPK